MKNSPAPDASILNSHLAKGGAVQVSTYGRSTIYTKRNAGAFETRANGDLIVKRGRSTECLGTLLERVEKGLVKLR